MDPRLQNVALDAFEPAWEVVAPSGSVADVLRAAGRTVRAAPLRDLPTASARGCALGDLELSRAGEHAEGLLAEVARVLEPGGVLLVTAASRLHARATGRDIEGLRPFSAGEVRHALGHRGFDLSQMVAVGAAAALRGYGAEGDEALDRAPGLLDAGPVVAAVAHNATSPAAATRAFVGTLPLKVVAAATICRDAAGRVLLVHDSFRQHWTIPGGVVDADEDPFTAAERETWEEAGLRVNVGDLLGVFAAFFPDRVLFVYGATPVGPPDAQVLRPVHTHEVDAVEWAELPEALGRVAPRVKAQLRRCLDSPGRTWRE